MMNGTAIECRQRPGRQTGSILVYVLWILVIITALVLQLGGSSRAQLLERHAAAAQLQQALQRRSAQQFAEFRILAGDWNIEKYRLYLNDEEITIRIFNESGFISLHELSSPSLKKAFQAVSLNPELLEKLEKKNQQYGEAIKINDINELAWMLGLSSEQLWDLMERVSPFHDGPPNPRQAPLGVLQVLSRVDQLRVHALAEAETPEERQRLRDEIVEQLELQNTESGDELSPYYRIQLTTARRDYRILVRYDRKQRRFKTLSTRTRVRPDGRPKKEEAT